MLLVYVSTCLAAESLLHKDQGLGKKTFITVVPTSPLYARAALSFSAFSLSIASLLRTASSPIPLTPLTR